MMPSIAKSGSCPASARLAEHAGSWRRRCGTKDQLEWRQVDFFHRCACGSRCDGWRCPERKRATIRPRRVRPIGQADRWETRGAANLGGTVAVFGGQPTPALGIEYLHEKAELVPLELTPIRWPDQVRETNSNRRAHFERSARRTRSVIHRRVLGPENQIRSSNRASSEPLADKEQSNGDQDETEPVIQSSSRRRKSAEWPG